MCEQRVGLLKIRIYSRHSWRTIWGHFKSYEILRRWHKIHAINDAKRLALVIIILFLASL